MNDSEEFKFCNGCGKVFYKKDIPPDALKFHKFSSFKRCTDCRHRTDIRNTSDYYTKRKKKSIDINRIIPVECDSYLRLVAACAHYVIPDLLNPNEQDLLEKRLEDDIITSREKRKLKGHYSAMIFLMDTWGGTVHFQDAIPQEIMNRFNKDVLLSLLLL